VTVTGAPLSEGFGEDTSVVSVVAGVVHVERVMVSLSSVTDPLRARARPSMVTPVVTVIEVRARIVPRKVESVPRVAELPTCQKTLQALAPLIRLTLLLDPVMSVEAVWKMKTASGLFWASRVTVPVSSKVWVAAWA
jgi:hypothetical protein